MSSETGSAGSSGPALDPSKYARLAAEYSKLRAHLNVLKRAVLDEQGKNAELKEALRDREVDVRKRDLEIDSLNFRNQQLTKRVTVLQDDIESLQSRKVGKKGKSKGDERPGPAIDDRLLQEELQKKIIENAQLVSQMSDKEFELSQLKLRVSDAERQLTDVESKYKCDIMKLRIQNQELVSNLDSVSNYKEKSSVAVPNTPNRNSLSNPTASLNGDYVSDVGSLIGSEDGLSVEESHLNDQLRKKTEMINDKEQENQNLTIELDLLKMELKILNSKLETLDEQRANSEASAPEDSRESRDTVSTLIGKVDCPVVLPEEIALREENLKTYFRNKISDLISERQEFESTTKYHIDENDSLRTHLGELKKEKELLNESLTNTQSTISRLEDELHSTNTNYEQQVILLSEHVGNLNDKIAQQAEEIQKLKGNL